jgi:hypothetical protein
MGLIPLAPSTSPRKYNYLIRNTIREARRTSMSTWVTWSEEVGRPDWPTFLHSGWDSDPRRQSKAASWQRPGPFRKLTSKSQRLCQRWSANCLLLNYLHERRNLLAKLMVSIEIPLFFEPGHSLQHNCWYFDINRRSVFHLKQGFRGWTVLPTFSSLSPVIGSSSVDWAQLSRSFIWGQRQSSVFETLFQIKRTGQMITSKSQWF